MRYAQIRNMDISNGKGVGVALFVQGCKFHCSGCFNSDTWDFNGGKEWNEETENKLLSLADKPYITRLSILGGEPLAEESLDGVLHLVDRFHVLFPQKTIWIYSGYEWYDIFYQSGYFYPQMVDVNRYKRQEIISKCNVFVDGRYEEDKRDITLNFRGSSNQRVIDIQKSIEENKIILYCN